jgi:putative peptidoglycan lipid II flippase
MSDEGPTPLLEPELPPEDSLNSYARNTAVMTVGTTLSRFTGFLRIAVQAAVLGVTVSTLADTYNRANNTPNILYELALGGILTSVFVPLFVEWMKKEGQDQAWALADRIFTLTLVGLSLLALLGMVFAPWIMRLYGVTPGTADPQAQLALGTYLLRWFMPQVVFYGIGAVAGGLLNANRRFVAPMFAPILNNVAVIATFGVYVWLLHGSDPSVPAITSMERAVLAIGTTLGVVAMTLALWPSVRHLGYRWHFKLDWHHPAVRRLVRLSGWVVVYVVANQLAFLIIIRLASHITTGYFSAYLYAFIVVSLPYAIFVVSIFTALVPGMAGQWATGSSAGIARLFSRGTRDTIVIILPASLGLAAIAMPVSRLIFENFHSGAADARLIGELLQVFALSLPFFSVFQLLTRTCYAMQDTRTPALVNVAAAVVNIAADVFFVYVVHWRTVGLVVGYGLSYVFGVAVLTTILRGRLGNLDGRRIARTLLRTLPAAALSALAAWGATRLFPTGSARILVELVTVLVAVSVGMLAFGLCALIFRIEEVDEVKGAVLRRFRS